MESLRLGRETNFPEALTGHPGLGAFGVGRELRNISSMLHPGEYLLDILQGHYANQTGVLLRTTTRLLFFGKGIISTKVEEFPLDKLTSVQYSTGLLMGEVAIFASGNKAEIKATAKAHTRRRLLTGCAANSTLGRKLRPGARANRLRWLNSSDWHP